MTRRSTPTSLGRPFVFENCPDFIYFQFSSKPWLLPGRGGQMAWENGYCPMSLGIKERK